MFISLRHDLARTVGSPGPHPAHTVMTWTMLQCHEPCSLLLFFSDATWTVFKATQAMSLGANRTSSARFFDSDWCSLAKTWWFQYEKSCLSSLNHIGMIIGMILLSNHNQRRFWGILYLQSGEVLVWCIWVLLQHRLLLLLVSIRALPRRRAMVVPIHWRIRRLLRDFFLATVLWWSQCCCVERTREAIRAGNDPWGFFMESYIWASLT